MKSQDWFCRPFLASFHRFWYKLQIITLFNNIATSSSGKGIVSVGGFFFKIFDIIDGGLSLACKSFVACQFLAIFSLLCSGGWIRDSGELNLCWLCVSTLLYCPTGRCLQNKIKKNKRRKIPQGRHHTRQKLHSSDSGFPLKLMLSSGKLWSLQFLQC